MNTPRDSVMSLDIHALSGAYAVDGVDDIERAQFERHLSGCASCRAEVDGLRETATMMAETCLQSAPVTLRARVLTAAATTRPLPPVVSGGLARHPRRRVATLVAAAAAALIALGGAGASVWHPWDQSRPGLSAAQSVANASDAQRFEHALSSTDGKVTVIRSKSLNEAIISTEGLPRLTEDQVYELWLLHDGRKVQAGLIDGDATNVILDGDPAHASGAAITIERAGGSEVPQGSLVAQIDFAQA